MSEHAHACHSTEIVPSSPPTSWLIPGSDRIAGSSGPTPATWARSETAIKNGATAVGISRHVGPAEVREDVRTVDLR